jgi:bifunctional non-homologous end joining protein LigD
MTSRPLTPTGRSRTNATLDPDALRPMLPALRDEPFDSSEYIYEVKWGGVRAIAVIEDGRVRLHGRNLRDLTPLYPELDAVPASLRAESCVLDGELIAWGAENLPSFDLLRPRLLRPDERVAAPRRSPIIYQVFDLLEADGEWLLERPLVERRNELHERLRPNRIAQAADFIRDDGIAFFEAVSAYKLEGTIAKDKHSAYLPGERSAAWQEVRAAQSDDFVIGGYTFGGGRKKDLIASLLLGAYESGRLRLVGQVSIGCSDREMRQLLDMLTPLHADASPFDAPPEVDRFLYWCRPELACHVRYSQWGPDGLLRFPVFVAPRPDVPPEECVASRVD